MESLYDLREKGYEVHVCEFKAFEPLIYEITIDKNNKDFETILKDEKNEFCKGWENTGVFKHANFSVSKTVIKSDEKVVVRIEFINYAAIEKDLFKRPRFPSCLFESRKAKEERINKAIKDLKINICKEYDCCFTKESERAPTMYNITIKKGDPRYKEITESIMKASELSHMNYFEANTDEIIIKGYLM